MRKPSLYFAANSGVARKSFPEYNQLLAPSNITFLVVSRFLCRPIGVQIY